MYEYFQELLDKFGVTAYKVAKETGLTTATLTNWKKGKYTPKSEKLQKIADYFGVPLAYFSTGQIEEPEPQKPTIMPRNARDIAKDLNNIMEKLTSEDTSPAIFNGEEISPEAAELFKEELDIVFRRLKLINKK